MELVVEGRWQAAAPRKLEPPGCPAPHCSCQEGSKGAPSTGLLCFWPVLLAVFRHFIEFRGYFQLWAFLVSQERQMFFSWLAWKPSGSQPRSPSTIVCLPFPLGVAEVWAVPIQWLPESQHRARESLLEGMIELSRSRALGVYSA